MSYGIIRRVQPFKDLKIIHNKIANTVYFIVPLILSESYTKTFMNIAVLTKIVQLTGNLN